jgi:hypothetical protein
MVLVAGAVELDLGDPAALRRFHQLTKKVTVNPSFLVGEKKPLPQCQRFGVFSEVRILW